VGYSAISCTVITVPAHEKSVEAMQRIVKAESLAVGQAQAKTPIWTAPQWLDTLGSRGAPRRSRLPSLISVLIPRRELEAPRDPAAVMVLLTVRVRLASLW
jgi:hypothetical protein